MMDCENARQESMAESYLAGRLSKDEREKFEQHYFECDACFAELETLRSLKLALPSAQRPVSRSPLRLALWALPLAAALLLSFYLIPRRDAQAPPKLAVAPPPASVAPEPSYAALARFDPPPWKAVTFRGDKTSAQSAFEKSMTFYTAQNYPACATALHPIPLTGARYYEGICSLLAGQTEAGADALRQTIAAGDTPYLEEARFYLAKAMLSGNKPTDARNLLNAVIGMRGDLERAASDLLTELH